MLISVCSDDFPLSSKAAAVAWNDLFGSPSVFGLDTDESDTDESDTGESDTGESVFASDDDACAEKQSHPSLGVGSVLIGRGEADDCHADNDWVGGCVIHSLKPSENWDTYVGQPVVYVAVPDVVARDGDSGMTRLIAHELGHFSD